MSTRTAPQVTPLWFIDGLVRVHVSGEETDGRYAVVENNVPQGDMPPLHVHHEEDEVFHVLDGEVTLFLPGQEALLTAGETFRAPRGIPHTFRVESPTARLLVFCSPARFDGFVRAVSEPAPAEELPPRGRPFDPGEFAATAAEYGIELLGPPGALPED
jgi:quercetin dioxygenase-like cupin family protein